MSRFDDDLHLVDPSEFVPTIVGALLRQAGVDNASAADQARAIREWLKAHQPSPMMEYSIRDSGFGELLDAQTSARGARHDTARIGLKVDVTNVADVLDLLDDSPS